MSARIAPASCARVDELADRAAQRVAHRLRGRREVDLGRHLLGERAVAGLELRAARRRTCSNAAPGIGLAPARARRRRSSDSYIALEDGLDERLLGREVPAHGADADAGAARDLLDLRPQARSRRTRPRPRRAPAPGCGGRRRAGVGRRSGSRLVSIGSHDSVIVADPEARFHFRSPRPARPKLPTSRDRCSHHRIADRPRARPTRRVRPALVDARGAVPEPADRLRRQLEPQRRDPDALPRAARDRVAAAVGRRELLARVRRACCSRPARSATASGARARCNSGSLLFLVGAGARVAGRRRWGS